MAKWKKLLIFIPLFLWTVMVLFLYFYMIIANGDKHDGEAYIDYFLLLFHLTFPLGSLALIIFSLLNIVVFDDILPKFEAMLMGIVAISAFYFQWYVLCPKLWRYFFKKLKRNTK